MSFKESSAEACLTLTTLSFCNSLQIDRLQSEFSSYKIRAHALLQKKDMELAAAKDSEQIKSLEEALKVSYPEL